MPIEVRELVVRAVVDEETEAKSKQSANTQGVDREEIVADCIDQVMEILRNKTDR